MSRTEIINKLIEKYGYKSYLEIGVNYGVNAQGVKCAEKFGVDPRPMPTGEPYTTHKETSDAFFFSNIRKYDIIFVDGLHHADQVYKDIKNGLKYLNAGGTIVCHDMNPTKEIWQKVPRETQIWNGDCWKAWVQLRSEHNDLEMFVVDTDWGCGVIRAGKQPKLIVKEPVTYENLEINRKKWLNLIEVSKFDVYL